MSSYKKALVALDIYDQSEKVLAEAGHLVGKGCEVHLCTVVVHLDSVYAMGSVSGFAVSTGGLQAELKADAERGLKSIAEKLDIPESQTHVLVGKASNEIKALAESSACDLIVLGTHGKGALRAMLGSTSNGVLHGAPCDVLAVKYKSP